MNSPQQESPFSEALTRNHWDVPIRVRLMPYVEFTCWLDEELEKLVERWAEKAAPNARQRWRR
jgi:hypothetical protein